MWSARLLRQVLLLVLAAALASSGCGGGGPLARPSSTPDLSGQRSRAAALLEEGRQALAAGDYQLAVTTLQRARLEDPDRNPEISRLLEQARSALGTPVAGGAIQRPTPTLAPDSVLIAYQFNPDSERHYRVRYEAVGTAAYVDRGKTGEENISAGISMDILEHVLATSSNGMADVEYRLGDIKSSFNGAVLQSLWLAPPERLAGRLSSDGTAAGFERGDETLAGLLFGFGATPLERPQLTRKAVRPGDTWTSVQTLGGFKRVDRVTFVGLAAEQGPQVARIAGESTMPLQRGTGPYATRGALHLNWESYIDLGRGYLKSTNGQGTFDLKLRFSGMEYEVNLDLTYAAEEAA